MLADRCSALSRLKVDATARAAPLEALLPAPKAGVQPCADAHASLAGAIAGPRFESSRGLKAFSRHEPSARLESREEHFEGGKYEHSFTTHEERA